MQAGNTFYRLATRWLSTILMLAIFCCLPCIAQNFEDEDRIQESIKSGDYGAALAAVELALTTIKEPEARMRQLNKAGWLNQRLGKIAAARTAYEDSVECGDKFLPQHSLQIVALSNLGAILYSQSDLERARPLFDRALKLAATTAPSDSEMIDLLTNYAGLLDAVGEPDKAADSYRRAIAIASKLQPPNKLQLSMLYNGLACNLSDRGQSPEAAKMFEETLQLQVSDLGENSFEVADTLNNLGVLAMDVRDLPKSRDYLQRALHIYEEKAGKLHAITSGVYLNLGDLAVLEGDTRRASVMYLQSARGVDSYFIKVLPGLSLAERQAELVAKSEPQLARLLSFCMLGDPLIAAQAYSIFCKWKGALISSMASLQRNNTADKEKLAQLQDARQKLAAWYFQIGNVSLAQWQETNDELTRRKERLERELTAGTVVQPDPATVLVDGISVLPLNQDEALVDIYRYEALGVQLQRTDRYAAVIAQPGTAPLLIDLGEAAAFDSLHCDWINAVSNQGDASVVWEQLRAKLQPVFTSLGATFHRVLICPDGELARVPWQLVPGDPKFKISQINAPQELVVMRGKSRRSGEFKLLAVGGIDFDALVAANETEVAPIKLEPLPGTLAEANAVADLARKQNLSATELVGKDATKQKLLNLLPTMTDVHIATHGFFFDQSTMLAVRNAVEPISGTGHDGQRAMGADRGIAIRSRSPASMVAARNPLVESGIALAGANHCSADDSVRSGFLTAEEIIGTDLSGCKLVTLSACDTGRGEKVTGQGVLGLRAALVSAGVKTVVMSLWKVPDLPTTELMRNFYANLWQKKMCPADSLSGAQATMREKHPASPGFWAGWVIVGDGW